MPISASPESARAFTLVDLLVAVVLLAILMAIALPSFSAYVLRGRLAHVSPALTATTGLLEQARLKLRSYDDGTGQCAVSFVDHPAPEHFSFRCDLTADGTGFLLTATSLATIAASAKPGDYVYTVNHKGERSTLRFGGRKYNRKCWITDNDKAC